MVRQGGELFTVVVVVAVDLFCVHRVLFLFRDDQAGLQHRVLEGPALLCVVADDLGHNVPRPLQGRRGVLDLLREILHRFFLRTARRREREQPVRQGLQSGLDGGRRAGLFLLHIGPVEVLHLRELPAGEHRGADLIGQLALLGNQPQDVLLAFGQAVLIVVLLLDTEDLLLVEALGLLLAVAGNKGDRVPLLQHFQGVAHLGSSDVQFLRQCGNDFVFHSSVPFLRSSLHDSTAKPKKQP